MDVRENKYFSLSLEHVEGNFLKVFHLPFPKLREREDKFAFFVALVRCCRALKKTLPRKLENLCFHPVFVKVCDFINI